MTRAELQPLPPPWRSQALSPTNAHDAESSIYTRRFFKLMCRSCADALAAASDDTSAADSMHFEKADEVQSHLQRIRATSQETAQLMSTPGPVADQAVQQLNRHAPKLLLKGKGGPRDAPNCNYACQLLEVLSEFQLLPFSANESDLQPTLVPAPEPQKSGAGDSDTGPLPTHACFGVHFGSEFHTSASVCAKTFQASRPKLQWELRDYGMPQGTRHADVGDVCKALQSVNAVAAHNNIQGPALVFHIPSDGASTEGMGGARSAQVAAAAALALSPGGCFVTRLTGSIAAQDCLEVSAVAGAAFEGVFLYQPTCAPMPGSNNSVWLLARNKKALSQDGANNISKRCGLLSETSSDDDMHTWHIPLAQELRQSFVSVCEWAAERAEAELRFVRLGCESSDGSDMLLGVGERWAKFYSLPSLFQGRSQRPKLKGWLKNPPAPRAAPRIPAGLAQQHMVVEMRTSEPTLAEDSAMEVAAPFANPDDTIAQPPAPVPVQPEPAAVVQLRTTEAPTATARPEAGGEQPVQEFQGEIMTYNEAKGWERVAVVQSHGWPTGVPIPKQFRIHKFAAKPASISRFCAISPRRQADSQQLTSLLGYLNRPASSLGGRKRMGVMNSEGADGLDMGVVAGSDGSGGIGGIVFCLRDAQMS